MKNPIKMDVLGVITTIFGNIQTGFVMNVPCSGGVVKQHPPELKMMGNPPVVVMFEGGTGREKTQNAFGRGEFSVESC